MTEQLLQGGGLFEITDHTTASDWERFIAVLEEFLTDWNLNKQSSKEEPHIDLPPGYISRGIWHEKHDVINFGRVSFDLRYQYLDESEIGANELPEKDDLIRKSQLDSNSDSSECNDYQDAEDEEKWSSEESSPAKEEELEECSVPIEEEREHGEHELPDELPDCLLDLTTTTNDFASKAHCLVRWYNLRRFIILSPKGDTIISEDRVKLVLSSASIALSNVDCHIPIFLQIRNPRNNFYQGISEHLNIRAMYEMVFYKKAIKQYSHLSEVINLFREKAGCSLNDPITVTIRLNYCLDSFDLFVEPKDEFSGNEHIQDEDELLKMTRDTNKKKQIPRHQDMRTSATFEQVLEALEDTLPHPFKIMKFLHIAALWPPLSDKVITDSQVHTDLDPAEAPVWTIRCVTSDNCNMKIVHETQAFYALLNAAIDYAYEKLDADMIFSDCDRESLKAKCLRICYELAIKPEVILSENPSDSIRKLVALLFYRASEIAASEDDALGQIAGQLKKRPSLSEIYRNFSRKYRPSVKEFIIRTQISRPFNPKSSPALPQRMFCTICDEEFRLCGAFTELCN